LAIKGAPLWVNGGKIRANRGLLVAIVKTNAVRLLDRLGIRYGLNR
jgi:hypothetical protein